MNKINISELIDEELNSASLEETINELTTDQSAIDCWSTYHLIGQVLRAEANRAPIDLLKRINIRLEGEPVVLSPTPAGRTQQQPQESERKQFRPWRAVGALALAASMAAFVLIVLMPTVPPSVTELAGNTSGTISSEQAAGAHAESFSQEMGSLLVEHGEFTSTMGLNGLLAYAKMVSNEPVSRTPSTR